MIESLLIAAAGAWRYFDGTSGRIFNVHIPTAIRNTVFVILALAGAYWSLGLNWWVLWLAAFASLNIIMGHTKWEDMLWQSARFGLGTVVTAGPYFAWTLYTGAVDWMSLAYGLSGVLIGPVYKLLEEKWARIPTGAIIIGGLCLLQS